MAFSVYRVVVLAYVLIRLLSCLQNWIWIFHHSAYGSVLNRQPKLSTSTDSGDIATNFSLPIWVDMLQAARASTIDIYPLFEVTGVL
jgi:hypothetical protein